MTPVDVPLNPGVMTPRLQAADGGEKVKASLSYRGSWRSLSSERPCLKSKQTKSPRGTAPTLPKHPRMGVGHLFKRELMGGLFSFRPPHILRKYRIVKLEVQARCFGSKSASC